MFTISEFFNALFLILANRECPLDELPASTQIIMEKFDLDKDALGVLFQQFDRLIFAEHKKAIKSGNLAQADYLQQIIDKYVPLPVRIKRDFRSILLSYIEGNKVDLTQDHTLKNANSTKPYRDKLIFDIMTEESDFRESPFFTSPFAR